MGGYLVKHSLMNYLTLMITGIFYLHLSTISVSKYLSDGFSFGIAGSFNKIDKWGDISTNPDVTNEWIIYHITV